MQALFHFIGQIVLVRTLLLWFCRTRSSISVKRDDQLVHKHLLQLILCQVLASWVYWAWRMGDV